MKEVYDSIWEKLLKILDLSSEAVLMRLNKYS